MATATVQHTPGPWKVRAGHFCDDGIPAYEVEMNGDANVNAADARLIAAAPDLLAACKEAWIALPETKYNEPINAMLKAAIAKAEGR